MQGRKKVCAYCLQVRSCGLGIRDDESLLKLGTGGTRGLSLSLEKARERKVTK